MFFANATVTVRTPADLGEFSDGVTRTVSLQPMAAGAAYHEFQVEVSNPYVLYDDVSAAAYYELHGRVEYGDQVFAVIAVPRSWGHLAAAAHVQVLLEEVRESQ